MPYESYRARLNSYGGNIQDSVSKITKRSQEQQILNSPTRKQVIVNNGIEFQYCLVSDVDNIQKRRFLFMPDFKVYSGDYIKHEDFTYLVTEYTTNVEIPEAIAELCNDTFTLTIEGEQIIVGRDDFNRPIYDTTDSITHEIPCVISTKTFNTVDNTPLPLPDGTIMMKIPYNPDLLPPINYEFIYHDSPYKVTSPSYDNVVNGKGYVEYKLQRFTGGDS